MSPDHVIIRKQKQSKLSKDKVRDKKCPEKYFLLYFSMETYLLGTHLNHIVKAILMSTCSVCFCGEIRKISTLFG